MIPEVLTLLTKGWENFAIFPTCDQEINIFCKNIDCSFDEIVPQRDDMWHPWPTINDLIAVIGKHKECTNGR